MKAVRINQIGAENGGFVVRVPAITGQNIILAVMERLQVEQDRINLIIHPRDSSISRVVQNVYFDNEPIDENANIVLHSPILSRAAVADRVPPPRAAAVGGAGADRVPESEYERLFPGVGIRPAVIAPRPLKPLYSEIPVYFRLQMDGERRPSIEVIPTRLIRKLAMTPARLFLMVHEKLDELFPDENTTVVIDFIVTPSGNIVTERENAAFENESDGTRPYVIHVHIKKPVFFKLIHDGEEISQVVKSEMEIPLKNQTTTKLFLAVKGTLGKLFDRDFTINYILKGETYYFQDEERPFLNDSDPDHPYLVDVTANGVRAEDPATVRRPKSALRREPAAARRKNVRIAPGYGGRNRSRSQK